MSKKAISVYADETTLEVLKKIQEKFNISSQSQAIAFALTMALENTPKDKDVALDVKITDLRSYLENFVVNQDKLLESRLKDYIEVAIRKVLKELLG